MFLKSNKLCPLCYWLVFFRTETSVSVVRPRNSKFKSNCGMHLNEYLLFATDRPRQRHVPLSTAQWEGRMLPWVPEPSLWLFVVKKPESWLFWLGRSAFSASSKVLAFACCFHFGFRSVLSVTNEQTKMLPSARAQRSAPPRPDLQSVTDKDTSRELSAPRHPAPRHAAPHQSLPDQSCSPWQTKILRESSALCTTRGVCSEYFPSNEGELFFMSGRQVPLPLGVWAHIEKLVL